MLPPWQMRALYDTHPAPPWAFVSFPQAGHMDAFDSAAAQYWPALREFVDGVVPPDAAAQHAQRAQGGGDVDAKLGALSAGEAAGEGAEEGAGGEGSGKRSWVLVDAGGGEEGEACDDPVCAHEPHA